MSSTPAENTIDLGMPVLRRSVRKAAVQMLSSAAHSKASLVAAQLPAVLPQLFQQTVIDPRLIRTVDLGPFKHKIDDGLELRKATFECMDVLLDACADRLDYTAFLEHLESGLKVCGLQPYASCCEAMQIAAAPSCCVAWLMTILSRLILSPGTCRTTMM